MGPVEALEMALVKEIAARDLYQEFSIKFPAVRDTFLFLLGEEEKHKKLIEQRIAQLSGQ